MKVDLTFWAMMPYTEKITYDIAGAKYSPVSYRFLCFALIVVTEDNHIELNISPEAKKAFKQLGNTSY